MAPQRRGNSFPRVVIERDNDSEESSSDEEMENDDVEETEDEDEVEDAKSEVKIEVDAGAAKKLKKSPINISLKKVCKVRLSSFLGF